MRLHRRAAEVETSSLARICHCLAAEQWSQAAALVDTLRADSELTQEQEEVLARVLTTLPVLVLRGHPALHALTMHPNGGPRLTAAARKLGLTARQMEVLALLAKGASNREIAERLVITLPTAKEHVSQILRKLGVGTRRAAVERATELGLLRR
jgi:ATP/maltotriose-dependent transcriptional regulator MalT